VMTRLRGSRRRLRTGSVRSMVRPNFLFGLFGVSDVICCGSEHLIGDGGWDEEVEAKSLMKSIGQNLVMEEKKGGRKGREIEWNIHRLSRYRAQQHLSLVYSGSNEKRHASLRKSLRRQGGTKARPHAAGMINTYSRQQN
jgi:hypothetical protein